MTQQNHTALISSINYAHLTNGEVIIKLHGEIIKGHILNIELDMGAGKITEFRIQGILES